MVLVHRRGLFVSLILLVMTGCAAPARVSHMVAYVPAPAAGQADTRWQDSMTLDAVLGGLRDRALFATAIDATLRAPDLLGLTVKDVRKRNRVMRDTVDLTIADTGRRIQCRLSKSTMNVLDKWINQSGKKPGDYLFTGRTSGASKAIKPRQFSRLVKFWAGEIGLDGSLYGTESLRLAVSQPKSKSAK